MSTILDEIVANKRQEIAAARLRIPEDTLRSQVAAAPEPRDFFSALSVPGEVRLIAEVKKASPSRGVIREDFDPVAIATEYQQHGAACISVLTDQRYFQGSFDYLRRVRQAVDIPVLCKEFILNHYQLLQARSVGADAVLLIAECLDDKELTDLHDQSLDLGMTPLVEFYETDNLQRVLAAGAKLVGINNRNLKTFKTDLSHTVDLRPHIPDDCVVVGESGIRTRADVEMLGRAGVQAILVGESLVASSEIGAAVDALLGK